MEHQNKQTNVYSPPPPVISNEKKNGRSPAIWCAQRRTESNPPLVGGRWS
jgi:hypothetical protein